MTKAFCPGHISCSFSPVYTNNVITTGSVGIGIRLNKGVTVTIEERSDGKTKIIMDGIESDAKITKHVINSLSPDRGYDVIVENQLPVSQGMGMSAAGAVAVGLCVTSVTGADEYEAYKAAHIAEVLCGGGLGDVAGITGGRTPVRVKAGLQPYGRTIDTELDINLTVAVLGPKIPTIGILSDKAAVNAVVDAGIISVNEFIDTRTEKKLYEAASKFSSAAGFETNEVKNALSLLRKDHEASMCMLGNSIFTNASEDIVRNTLSNAEIFSLHSSTDGPRVIRKV
jgi:pantoate kinase